MEGTVRGAHNRRLAAPWAVARMKIDAAGSEENLQRARAWLFELIIKH